MTKPTVYIETTIPSYLTAWPSRDPTRATDQQVTRDWWAQRDRFTLFTSQLVISECQTGDPVAATDRLASLSDMLILDNTDAVDSLVWILLRRIPIPPRAANDAVHIAIAAVYRMDYLLTWNCRHIANAVYRPLVNAIYYQSAVHFPTICTLAELLQES